MLEDFDVFSLKKYTSLRPGMEAWLPLALPGRFPLPKTGINYRQSAVAVPLFHYEGNLCTLVLLRSKQENDHHSGQLSLPGGKVEPDDADTISTALREMEEETGIRVDKNRYVAHLTKLAIPVSRFEVDPIIFYLNELPPITLSMEEAVSTHIVSLNSLPIDEIPTTDIFSSGVMLKNIPFLKEINGVPLWGATAMILSELIHWIRVVPQYNKL